MSIDDHLETQLAEYFGWLEGHLGTTMRSAEAAAPRRPRRRLALLLGVAAAAIALVAAALVVRNDDVPSIGPATSGAGDPTLPSTVPTTAGSTDTTVSTAPDLTGELTWAPLALPPTMELVDSGTLVDFGITAADTTTRAQLFARLGDDGETVEASLSLSVRPAEGDEVEAWIPNGEVHGLPAIISTPSLTATSAWWVEEDQVVTADATGFGRSDLLGLLESIEWRANRVEGFEPDSIDGGLALLYDSDLRGPRRATTYVVHDLQHDVYVRLYLGAPPRLFDVALHRTGAGLLMETQSDSRSHWMLLTNDALGVAIGYSPWGSEVDLEQASAIAESIRPATADQLATMRADVRARLWRLPVVDTVTIGTTTVELRGGTVDEPVALCLGGTGGLVCEFNDIHRDGDPQPDATARSVLLGDDWNVVGYGLGSLFTTEGQTTVEYRMQFCSANADGSLIALLPDERTDAHDREYFLVAVPADVDHVRVCVDADGELRPNSSGMMASPQP